MRFETVLEITDHKSNNNVTFRGTPIWPAEPRFVVTFASTDDTTRVTYSVEPEVKGLLEFMVPVGILWDGRELKTYLAQVKSVLEAAN